MNYFAYYMFGPVLWYYNYRKDVMIYDILLFSQAFYVSFLLFTTPLLGRFYDKQHLIQGEFDI